MEKKNLRTIRSLLAAGALVTVPDRKGLRACDVATWTEALQPVLMQPLQQHVMQLQQTNLRLEEHTHSLISLAQNLRRQREHVQLRTNVLQTDVDVSMAFRKDVLRQVENVKGMVQRLDDDQSAATARLARIRRDILALQSQRDGAQHDVGVCNTETGRIDDMHDRLVLQTHARQCTRLDALATQFALKCEVVRMAMRFEKNENLQAQSLRSLLQMCRKPATREKLVINGLQRLVLEIMQRFPKNESIYLDGCALILLLTQEADAANKEGLHGPTHEGDAAGARTTIGAWQTRPLVEFLTMTTLEFAHALAYEAVCEKTHEVLQCLRHSRHCSDVEDASELDEIVRKAYMQVVQHASFASLTCATLQQQLQNATEQG
uniref:Uncharacterized protein n=1 Tax=Globisporangium ultimum (strain ATCC 200006 / CBS 805.95 / DAOM BR144) TaxID=431595 RepID=K3WGQ1_GLOUD